MNSLLHKKLTDVILKSYYEVYNKLGYGFLEKVYQNAIVIQLKSQGLKIDTQKQITVYYKENSVGIYYADVIVNNLIIIELKCYSLLMEIHKAQLINYLKATDLEIGLLLNFGEKPEFKRIIYTNNRKQN